MKGLTPGLYATRSGKYEVRTDQTIWLIEGQDLPEGAGPRQVKELPRDAVMTSAALDAPTSAGTTPPGKGPHPHQVRRPWNEENE